MSRFLITIPHEAEAIACAKVVHVFLSSGSHFLSNADWGCFDGYHSAWFVVETESKEEARRLVPPAFRSDATIVGLNKFTMEQLDELLKGHGHAGVESIDA